jgi:transcriptional regulator of arginine metabolism
LHAYSATVSAYYESRERQGAILELVRERALSTQAEVAAALREAGYDVVQTTVSRDIAELGLVKVRAPSGGSCTRRRGSDGDRLRALGSAMRRYAVTVEAPASSSSSRRRRGTRTPSRSDGRGVPPFRRRTIAGDNTIFVATHDGASAQALEDELAGYLLQGAA